MLLDVVGVDGALVAAVCCRCVDDRGKNTSPALPFGCVQDGLGGGLGIMPGEPDEWINDTKQRHLNTFRNLTMMEQIERKNKNLRIWNIIKAIIEEFFSFSMCVHDVCYLSCNACMHATMIRVFLIFCCSLVGAKEKRRQKSWCHSLIDSIFISLRVTKAHREKNSCLHRCATVAIVETLTSFVLFATYCCVLCARTISFSILCILLYNAYV